MGSREFPDHFSGHADLYARLRPGYPPSLFDFLSAAAPGDALAIDVGTGNGQAARELASRFARVVATDASAAQLQHAPSLPNVTYRQNLAQLTGEEAGSCQLLTAAQAAHWFDWPAFGAEVRRVLAPGGVLALWTYELFRVDQGIDGRVDDFFRHVVGPYWPRARRHVEEGYAQLWVEGLERLDCPRFEFRSLWSADDALDYLATWSAVQRCRQLRGMDPLECLRPPLQRAWGGGRREVAWPIHLRAGCKSRDGIC
ncbi:MAG: class I SAM-dependent methyltransferase [Steroidobacteraceae bacterium]